MGDKGKGGQQIKIDPAKDYEKMIRLQLRYLPKQLQAEYANRMEWDPKLIEQALGLQHAYDPALAREQYAALQRRDPQWLDVHEAFGDKVKQAVERGYVDPQRAAAYGALGKQVTGDTLRGSRASPDMLRDMTQAILSRSPNLSYGEAQDMAAAVYTGQRGQQLQQQRQQANLGFLGQQSESDLALTAGGRYMSTPGVVQMENMIGGVQAPRAFGYVNPQAGMQGIQLGLQNQQANLANQALSGQGGGNPWVQALQGASTGASIGSNFGGYGAAGGAVTGAVAGAFGYPQYSDIKTKTDIVKVGEHDGMDVIEFTYKGDRNHARFRGVIAQQVREKFPDAVGLRDGFLTVDYDKIGLPMLKCCNQCNEFKPLMNFRNQRNQCRACGKAYKKQWVKENRDKYITAGKKISSRAWSKVMAEGSYVQLDLFRSCPKCCELKSPEAFYTRSKYRCKVCILAGNKEWRIKNPETIRIYRRKIGNRWQEANKEKVLAQCRIRDRKRRPQKRAWERQYRKSNVSFKIAQNLRRRIRTLLRNKGRTLHPLGCPVKDFMLYLESKFEPGMSWENYGTVWHVDHIIPCALFDLSKPEQQQVCFHFTNLQPMFAIENIKKGKKLCQST